MKLNLGSGDDYLNGWVNVEINPLQKADKRFDVTAFPYPIKDNSVSRVLCSHILEHFNQKLFWEFMNELYRITKNNARTEIRVPYYHSSLYNSVFDHKLKFDFEKFKNICNKKKSKIVFSDNVGKVYVFERKYHFKYISVQGNPTNIGKIIPEFLGIRKNFSYLLSDIVNELVFKIETIK